MLLILKQGYHLTLSLKGPRQGAHALGACQNHSHFGPQVAPSVKFLITRAELYHTCFHT